jgi:hypothetical protein
MYVQHLINRIRRASRTGHRHDAGGRAFLMTIGAVGMAAILCACSSGSSTTSVNTAAAPQDVSQLYGSFFHLSGSSLAALQAETQDGTALHTGLSQALASPDASLAGGASVQKVNVLSSSQCAAKHLPYPCAAVTYSILGTSGSALLTGQSGYAIYSNGKWLVSKSTVCNLLVLLYTAEGKSGSPPGC